MAYFSNGTEGEMYRDQYCNRCIHGAEQSCPIYLLHLMWNYEQHNDATKKAALDVLIPRSEDGLSNEQCKLFTVK